MLSNLPWFDILVQGLGVLGILSSVISFQCRTHGKIMLFRNGNEFLFAIQYLLLGAYTGMTMNIIGCVRNQLFAAQVKKGKSTRKTQIIFCLIFIAGGLVSWSGYKTILIIVSKILSTIAYGLENTKILRIIILFTSTSWLIYNFSVGSIAGMACEVFTLCSILVALFRLYVLPALRTKKKETE